MKAKSFFSFVIAAAIFLGPATLSLSAQTTLWGGTVSGTWTTSGSPYVVNGSIEIPNDSTLVIEPGVTVVFRDTDSGGQTYKLEVQGQLLAIGAPGNDIIFTVSDKVGGWRGIRFENTDTTNDTSKIIYCNIQYGHTTDISPDYNGGGLYFDNFSKAIVSHCYIAHCQAYNSGVAIYCNASSPVISYDTITNNGVSPGLIYGGAISCYGGNITISNNVISNNVAAYGGGIYCGGGSPQITNNFIFNNNNSIEGGGIELDAVGLNGISHALISNNTLMDNSAEMGGAIACFGTDTVTISNNIIANDTGNEGGGIGVIGNNSLTIIDNIITNCRAATLTYYTIGGGGLWFEDVDSTNFITNNVISNNWALNGGGISLDGSRPVFTNNTIVNNYAVYGGGLYCDNTSNAYFINDIFWGNTVDTGGAQVMLWDEPSDHPNFYNCDLQGGTAAFDLNGNFFTGISIDNINAYPKFISPSAGSGLSFDGLTANWALADSSSPCINAGDISDPIGAYPETDLAGNPRIVQCIIDIGAYEYQSKIASNASVSISTATTGVVCAGSAITYTATIVNSGTTYTYFWEKDGKAVASNTSLYVDSDVHNNDSVWIEMIITDTCSTTTNIVSNVLHIVAYPIIRDTINQTICPGDTFSGHTVLGAYTDTFTSASTGCDSLSVLILNVLPVNQVVIYQTVCSGSSFDGYTESGTYTKNYTGSNGCDSTWTLNLTVAGTYTITNDSQSICNGSAYNGHSAGGYYSDTFVLAGGCDSIYNLSLNLLPTYSTSAQHTICQGDTFEGHTLQGFYSDTLLSTQFGCDSVVTLELTVTPAPDIPSILMQGDTLITQAGIFSYQWYLDTALLTGDTTNMVIISQNGNYVVVVGNSQGCSSHSVTFNVTGLGIDEVDASRGLNIFPNPTNGKFNITEYGLRSSGEITLQLFDATGKVILSMNVNPTGNSYQQELDLEGFAEGLYLVRIAGVNGQPPTELYF